MNIPDICPLEAPLEAGRDASGDKISISFQHGAAIVEDDNGKVSEDGGMADDQDQSQESQGEEEVEDNEEEDDNAATWEFRGWDNRIRLTRKQRRALTAVMNVIGASSDTRLWQKSDDDDREHVEIFFAMMFSNIHRFRATVGKRLLTPYRFLELISDPQANVEP